MRSTEVQAPTSPTCPQVNLVGSYASERNTPAAKKDGVLTDLDPFEIIDNEVDGLSPPFSQEKWNSPKINISRYCVCNLSLLIMGMNDACLGALLPYIGTYYNVNYTQISTVFVVPFIAYIIAGLVNNLVHEKFGQRGVAIIGPVFRLIGYIPICLHPPFPVLPIALLFAGFGNGIEDSGYNAWVGNMQNANELLGLLHGSYGLGATISPLVASAMVTKAGYPWYTFYYVLIGVVIVEFIAGLSAFWTAGGKAYRAKVRSHADEKRVTTRKVLQQPLTWLISVFLLGYVGVEVTLGGWIPTFMLEVRHAEPFLSGLAVTLFWLGLTVGRVILGFVTGKIGEKLAISAYLCLSIVFQALYWAIPNFVSSLIFIILLGFFLGPLFPAAIVTATKLFPPSYHVSAIGFAAAFGGGGAAFIPFMVGAIAQSRGVAVLQPFVLALLVFILVCWSLMPGGYSKSGLEKARADKPKIGVDFLNGLHHLKGVMDSHK